MEARRSGGAQGAQAAPGDATGHARADFPDHAGSRSSLSKRLLVVTSKQPFEEVVSQHGRTVLRVCRAVLGRADADDAWSETFLSALKAYPQLPVDANVEAWLVTIAHRKAIDVTRGSARRATPVAEVP